MGLTEKNQNFFSLTNSQSLIIYSPATATVLVLLWTWHDLFSSFLPTCRPYSNPAEIPSKAIIVAALHIAIQTLLTSHNSKAYSNTFGSLARITFKL